LGVVSLGLLLGCGRSHDSSTPAAGGADSAGDAPTWHQDIAPLVAAHCQGCHHDGGIAPFSLQTYAQAKMWSSSFDAVLKNRTMPPFLAEDTSECKPRFGFKEDLRLSVEQIDLFKSWNDAGCPEGDPASAKALPQPPKLELDDADVKVTIPAPVTVEGPGDRFVCFSLAPDLSALAASGADAALLGDTVLVDGMQITPGNPAIVHHVLVYADPDGQSAARAGDQGYYDCFGGPKLDNPALLMAWAPGATPLFAPQGVAIAVPSKGRIVIQVHYHPTGSPQTDSGTSLSLRGYSEGIPEYIGSTTLVGNARSQKPDGTGLQPGPDDTNGPKFLIPAGATAHTESMLFKVPDSYGGSRIWVVGTHMHYVGTDMRIGIQRAAPSGSDPAQECLLETPHWDFNWQRGYVYDTPIADAPAVDGGDTIALRCTYDNSMGNPFVQRALTEQGLTEPRDVALGEETLDEMCLGVIGTAQKVSDLLK
jgi:hypothetical protein